jgi:hypothetical protein
MKYKLRCNTLRKVDESGLTIFTNNQHEIEIYTNQMIKGKDRIYGDLRIRKNNHVLIEGNLDRKIVTLNKEGKNSQSRRKLQN